MIRWIQGLPRHPFFALCAFVLLLLPNSTWGADSASVVLKPLADALIDVDEAQKRKLIDLQSESQLQGSYQALAVYGTALLYVQVGDYTAAVKHLEQCPKGVQHSPPFLRLRLWLALQTREKESARQIFASLVKLQSSNTADAPETIESRNFLAACMAIDAASGSLELLDATERSLARQSAISMTDEVQRKRFEREETKTHARSAELRSVAEHWQGEGKEGAAMALANAKAAMEEAERGWREMESTYGPREAQIEKELKQNSQTQSQARAKASQADRLARTPIPGRPNPPSKPREPGLRVSSGNGISSADAAKYEREQRDYESKLANYEAQRRVYENQRQDWEDRNRQHYNRKIAERNAALQIHSETVVKRKELEQALENLKRERETQRDSLIDCRGKYQVITQVVKRFDQLPNGIYCPSLYSLLDASHERTRILRAMAAVAK